MFNFAQHRVDLQFDLDRLRLYPDNKKIYSLRKTILTRNPDKKKLSEPTRK